MDPNSDNAHCKICGTKGEKLTRRGPFTILNCGNCGFKWMDPMEVPDYDTADRGGLGVGYFGKERSKLRRNTRRAKMLFRRLGVSGRKPTLLDVGSNVGYMCEAARRVGFEATGVEPDSVSVAYARKAYPENTYLNGTIETVSLESGFNAVYCSEVIEHVPDPSAFVAKIAEAIRPGGLFYVTTPDIEHWRIRNIHPDRRPMFSPPRHCLYFTRPSLTRLLEQHGFEIIWAPFRFKPGIKMIGRRKS